MEHLQQGRKQSKDIPSQPARDPEYRSRKSILQTEEPEQHFKQNGTGMLFYFTLLNSEEILMRWSRRRRRRKSIGIVRTILPRNSLCRKGKVVQLLVICPPRAFIQIHPECVCGWLCVNMMKAGLEVVVFSLCYCCCFICWPVASFYLHP